MAIFKIQFYFPDQFHYLHQFVRVQIRPYRGNVGINYFSSKLKSGDFRNLNKPILFLQNFFTYFSFQQLSTEK